MGRPIDMERKGCESSIHDHDIALCVTTAGRVDVPESDRVTSEIGVPSTYLVICMQAKLFNQAFCRRVGVVVTFI